VLSPNERLFPCESSALAEISDLTEGIGSAAHPVNFPTTRSWVERSNGAEDPHGNMLCDSNLEGCPNVLEREQQHRHSHDS
jgi:hypothetical protein